MLLSCMEDQTDVSLNEPLDADNTTLLHLATNSPSMDVLGLLLQSDIDINAQNDDGLTALHVAAMWGRSEAVDKLLLCGADPSLRDVDNMLPFDYAKSEGWLLHCMHAYIHTFMYIALI